MGIVLGVKESSKGGAIQVEKKQGLQSLRKTFQQTYYVLADSPAESLDSIAASPGVPPLYFLSGGTYCISKKPKETHTIRHPISGIISLLYEVACDFDSNIDPGQNQPPEAKTPVTRWSGETEEEVLEKDPITLAPIETKAEEPLIITTPIVLPILEIKRYEFYPFDPQVMLDYVHHTNSQTFWGAPEGSALMMPMEVEEESLEGVRYVQVTYKIKFKIKKEGGAMLDDTWKARILHHGSKYVYDVGPPKDIRACEDEKGNPTTLNLKNSTGELVPVGSPAEYLEFNRFTKVNFNNLSLGPF